MYDRITTMKVFIKKKEIENQRLAFELHQIRDVPSIFHSGADK